MLQRPLPQKTIGILGGASDVATGEYYRMINAGVNARLGGWDIAETVIVGMNFGNIQALLRAGDWASLRTYMAGKVDALEAGGADLIIGVSNTLHQALAPIMVGRETAFLHIADPTIAAIKAAGLARIALFGTRSTMADAYMRGYYEARGIEIVTPDEAEIAEIDRIIFDELVKFEIRPDLKATYLTIADRLSKEAGAQGVILGCTEIFTLIEQADRPALPFFNTTALHCAAAVDWALGA